MPSALPVFLFLPSSLLPWPLTTPIAFFYWFLLEFKYGTCRTGLMTHLSVPLISFAPPLVLPWSGCLLLRHMGYQALLCYFSSGTFLLDFEMQTYVWNKGFTYISLRRDVWHVDMSLGTQVFYVTVYPSRTDQLWVCGFVSVFLPEYLKILQNSFYQGEILMYNKWMTIAIGKYYSLRGIQLQLSAYSPREHLNAEYHWHEAT